MLGEGESASVEGCFILISSPLISAAQEPAEFPDFEYSCHDKGTFVSYFGGEVSVAVDRGLPFAMKMRPRSSSDLLKSQVEDDRRVPKSRNMNVSARFLKASERAGEVMLPNIGLTDNARCLIWKVWTGEITQECGSASICLELRAPMTVDCSDCCL